MQACKQICKAVTKHISYGSFKIPYQENVCAFDQKCLDHNKNCQGKLMALMQAAAKAEAALKAAGTAKDTAKASHQKAAAAAKAAGAEMRAAHAAMAAAKSAFEAATAQAAAAKKRHGVADDLHKRRVKELANAVKAYETLKAAHLKAVAAYEGANSAAAKAYQAYMAAVKKHCDAEAVHASLIAQLGMPAQKKTCENQEKNVQTSAKGLPCTPKPCFPVCKQVAKKTCYGSYCIPYHANECAPDHKCESANKACTAKLMGIMQAAAKAEKDLAAKAGVKNSAKASHEEKKKAAALAKNEAQKAKKALDAGAAEVKLNEQETASAAASAANAKKESQRADSNMSAKLSAFEKTKSAHLKAQAHYQGKASEAAEASKKYDAAVKAHCDAERVHADLVTQMNMKHLAQRNCDQRIKAAKHHVVRG
jgi:hypothetical protein